jgi:hypothetical protein
VVCSHPLQKSWTCRKTTLKKQGEFTIPGLRSPVNKSPEEKVRHCRDPSRLSRIHGSLAHCEPFGWYMVILTFILAIYHCQPQWPVDHQLSITRRDPKTLSTKGPPFVRRGFTSNTKKKHSEFCGKHWPLIIYYPHNLLINIIYLNFLVAKQSYMVFRYMKLIYGLDGI